MRISDWSSDVCSSDLAAAAHAERGVEFEEGRRQQRLDVEVDADGRVQVGVVGPAEQLQNAAVEGLRQMLEQPAVGREIDVRQHRSRQIADREYQLLEDRPRRRVRLEGAERTRAE